CYLRWRPPRLQAHFGVSRRALAPRRRALTPRRRALAPRRRALAPPPKKSPLSANLELGLLLSLRLEFAMVGLGQYCCPSWRIRLYCLDVGARPKSGQPCGAGKPGQRTSEAVKAVAKLRR